MDEARGPDRQQLRAAVAVAGDVRDDTSADQRVDEGATPAPKLQVWADLLPAAADELPARCLQMLPRVGSRPDRLGLHEVTAGVLSELADDSDLDPYLLERFPPGGFLDRLARLDSASRDDRVDSRVTKDVEHEQLVDAGLGMLTRDVDDHRWAGPHRSSATFSAIAIVERCTVADGIVGMIEASATTTFGTPSKCPFASTTLPSAQVPVGWKKPRAAWRT